MLWARRLSLRLQTLFRREGIAKRLDDEMQFHIEQQIAENIAAGMNPQEARYSAMRTFGNPTFVKKKLAVPGAGSGSSKLRRTFAMARERWRRIQGSRWSQSWRSRWESG